MALFPRLDKGNSRDKAKSLCITSEGYNRVNLFCLPGWVLLDNRTVCEVVIEGAELLYIVVCARFSSGFIYELLLVRRRNE